MGSIGDVEVYGGMVGCNLATFSQKKCVLGEIWWRWGCIWGGGGGGGGGYYFLREEIFIRRNRICCASPLAMSVENIHYDKY